MELLCDTAVSTGSPSLLFFPHHGPCFRMYKLLKTEEPYKDLLVTGEAAGSGAGASAADSEEATNPPIRFYLP